MAIDYNADMKKAWNKSVEKLTGKKKSELKPLVIKKTTNTEVKGKGSKSPKKLSKKAKDTQLKELSESAFGRGLYNTAEGFMDSMTLGQVSKDSEKERAKNEKLYDKLHSGKAAGFGNFVGQSLGFMTQLPAGRALVTGVPKTLATKTLPAKAGQTFSKAGIKALPKKTITRSDIAKDLMGEFAIDSTVGLTQNMGIARGKGLEGDEYVKDVLQNQAIDYALGGLISLPSAKKALKNIPKKKAVKNVAESVGEVTENVAKDLPITKDVKDGVQMAIEDIPTDKRVAQVTLRTEKPKAPLKETLKEKKDTFIRRVADSGDRIYQIGKETGNKDLYAKHNMWRGAQNRTSAMLSGKGQYSFDGKRVGDSAKEIFDPIFKKGDNYYKEFQEFLYHKHNVDRMAVNKPVFGDITAEESAEIATKLLEKNPNFAKESAKVYNYFDNLMQYRVDSGLVSKDTADMLSELYENYVPTYRVMSDGIDRKGVSQSNRLVKVKPALKEAKGSSLDLLPLHEQVEKLTEQTVNASLLNDFGRELMDTVNDPHLIKSVNEIDASALSKDMGIDEVIDVTGESGNGLIGNTIKEDNGNYSFVIRRDGKAYEMTVDKGIFEAIGGGKKYNNWKIPTTLNKGFKNLVTTYNPLFTVRNALRDFPDAFIFTKQKKTDFVKNYGKAWKEIVNNGDAWNQYKALGGEYGSFFDIAKQCEDGSWFRRNILDRWDMLNQAVEQAPRLSEFIGEIEKHGNNPKSIRQGLMNAQDLTVNFGRSGEAGKWLNSNAVPFFNAGVQEALRLGREVGNVLDGDLKRLGSLLWGATVFGIAPSAINEFLVGDRESYQRMTTDIKDTYYLIPLDLFGGDSDTYIRIPKGRVSSVPSALVQRGIRDDMGNTNENETMLSGFGGFVTEQLAPTNPVTNNLFAPLIQSSNNKTWYGTPIESEAIQNLPIGERADEGTTALSKFIGENTGISPKKLDYVLNQYTGIIGDVVMPPMTSKAEKGIISNAFLTDSVTSNRLSQDYYKLKDEYNLKSNGMNGTPADAMVYKSLNDYQSEISEITKQIREINRITNLDDKTKAERIRRLRAKQNKLYEKAMTETSKNKEKFEMASEQGFKKYADYEMADSIGFTADKYYRLDSNNNNRITQAEVKAYLDRANYPQFQKRTIFKKLFPDAKKNPY